MSRRHGDLAIPQYTPSKQITGQKQTGRRLARDTQVEALVASRAESEEIECATARKADSEHVPEVSTIGPQESSQDTQGYEAAASNVSGADVSSTTQAGWDWGLRGGLGIGGRRDSLPQNSGPMAARTGFGDGIAGWGFGFSWGLDERSRER